MNKKFGLIGTITHDVITLESGQSFEGIGGVLYQAAVLCGMGREVFLYTNLGEELEPEVDKITGAWPTLQREGVIRVPGPGNQVHLHYPEKGERIEILKSVVPPLNPSSVLQNIHELEMLILVINSGFDIEFSDWRKIVAAAKCPIWFDIHSLLLSRNLNIPREYLPLFEWKNWIEGVSFVQANTKEVASMLGCPDKVPSDTEMSHYGKMAFDVGVEAVFITLGKEGVFVVTPKDSRKITPPGAEKIIDTTGCGDVFCGTVAVETAEGSDPFNAASFGLKLATKAVEVKGIKETYILVRENSKKVKKGKGNEKA